MVCELMLLVIIEMIMEQKKFHESSCYSENHFLNRHTHTRTHASCPFPPAPVIMTYISCVTVSV